MNSKPKIKSVPPLFVIRATGAIRHFLMSLGRRMFPADYVMMEFASSFWVAKAIGVAADLGIADILKDGPLHISELAARTSTHEASLMRLLRVLSGNGIFRYCKGNIYCNTKLSEALTEDRHSMKYFIRHHLGDNNWSFVGELENCVRSGENAIKMKTGMEPFDFLREHPEKNELFSRAMTDSNEMSLPLFLAAYSFGRFKTICDVGGGHAYMLSAIVARNKGSKGIVFDLPHVVAQADVNFQKFGVKDRCRFIEGDFFSSIPAGADLYILKNILHDWDDDACVKILKNVRQSMNPGARILIIDAVVNNRNESSFGKILDLQMLIGTSGGRERSAEEFSSVLEEAGFRLSKLINTATPFYFIEARLKA